MQHARMCTDRLSAVSTPSFYVSMSNADSIIRVKINANIYLPNAENSITRGLPNTLKQQYMRKTTTALKAKHCLIFACAFAQPTLFYSAISTLRVFQTPSSFRQIVCNQRSQPRLRCYRVKFCRIVFPHFTVYIALGQNPLMDPIMYRSFKFKRGLCGLVAPYREIF
jgi:hypothetical protein